MTVHTFVTEKVKVLEEVQIWHHSHINGQVMSVLCDVNTHKIRLLQASLQVLIISKSKDPSPKFFIRRVPFLQPFTTSSSQPVMRWQWEWEASITAIHSLRVYIHKTYHDYTLTFADGSKYKYNVGSILWVSSTLHSTLMSAYSQQYSMPNKWQSSEHFNSSEKIT